MTKKIKVTTERIDDVPILIAHQEKMGLAKLLDKHFKSHGNRKGLSLGWLATIWLSHIISESDHRLNRLQNWAEKLKETLVFCTKQNIKELDFTDDRLEDLLRYLSNDEAWEKFEKALNKNTIKVYSLEQEIVRIDSTTALSYCGITEDGFFQYGYSKDKRPDLPQLKVNLATLDPLGMPLVTTIVKGNEADDNLYIPAIKEIKKSLAGVGKLYIGDSKMGALGTRCFIEKQRDYYLCPLSLVQLPQKELDVYINSVENDGRKLDNIYRTKADGTTEKIAEGYCRRETQTAIVDDKEITWSEQHFVVRSLKLADAGERSLRKRLEKTIKALEDLPNKRQGKKLFNSKDELKKAAEDVLAENKVGGLVILDYQETSATRTIRAYKDRPQRQVTQTNFSLKVKIDDKAVNEAIKKLGWRVYATNAPQQKLDIEKATLAYRNEFIIEREFGRLKGKPLSLSPFYLQRDDYATGLVRLLSIGLRILTLFEFIVRRGLKDQQLSGLYAGNPKRSTSNPTAEKLLEAFEHINFTVIHEHNSIRKFLTQLSSLQKKILQLLGFSSDVYFVLIE